MDKNKAATIGIIMLILAVAAGIIFLKNNSSSFIIKDTVLEEQAKWIGEHSVLYVQLGCSHCKEQEDLFGINVKYLNIIDGIKAENRQKFIDAGITNVPTWIINGQKYVGVQPIEKLLELTGYKE